MGLGFRALAIGTACLCYHRKGTAKDASRNPSGESSNECRVWVGRGADCRLCVQLWKHGYTNYMAFAYPEVRSEFGRYNPC